MTTKDWSDAQSVWSYIKSRHLTIRKDLSAQESATLDEFIQTKSEERVYLLRRGTLEDYLPEGYRSKDLNKLIGLIADGIWPRLSLEVRDELTEIAKLLMPCGT